MSLRVFFAALGAEVNSFAPIPIDRRCFEELWLYPAGTLPADGDPPLIAAPLRRLRQLERDGRVTVTQGLCAGAQPGGMIARTTYEGLRDELLADLDAAGPVDLVILGLHGATVADGYADTEGDQLGRVRARVGPDVTIAALLDPHCHMTPAMLREADILTAYKEYPHNDIFECADAIVDLALATVEGRARPVMRAWDCRAIGSFNTYAEPMASVVAELRAAMAAEPGLLDISIAHGFPWGDVPDLSARVWVTADDDAALAERIAERFGHRIEAIREAAQPQLLDIAAALALLDDAPSVLAETADNPGGGAPGDATHLLAALLDAGVTGIAAGLFWDPVAVALCVAAGEGAELPLRIGGKASALSGVPLDLEGRVGRIVDRLEQPFGGGLWPSGRTVRFDIPQGHVLLSETRTQCFATEAFTDLGVDLAATRAIVVKSSNHFEASFRCLTDRIHRVVTPGALTPDPMLLPYAQVRRPIWPLDGPVAGGPLSVA